ncbi:MAG: branched-chain amino acid ABC transporter permease, partial [Burkholderiales bacterium]|nr:branched-chain amino acid ABC transporter permease [Burkholderiales bacterium]
GFMALSFYAMFAAANWMSMPMWTAVAIGLLVTIAAGVAMEVFALSALRRRNSPPLTFFILTLVISQFLAFLMTLIFGTEPVPLTPQIMSPVRLVGDLAISDWDLRALTVAGLLLVALRQFVVRTRDGQFMMAVADNAGLAELYGISARRAWVMAFAAAGVLITAGMFLYGTRTAITPYTPLQMMIFAVVATLLGGVGRIFGAAAAAVVLSIIQGLSIFVIPSRWQGLLLYVFLFVTILFFPEGFRLRRTRRGRAPAGAAPGGQPT